MQRFPTTVLFSEPPSNVRSRATTELPKARAYNWWRNKQTAFSWIFAENKSENLPLQRLHCSQQQLILVRVAKLRWNDQLRVCNDFSPMQPNPIGSFQQTIYFSLQKKNKQIYLSNTCLRCSTNTCWSSSSKSRNLWSSCSSLFFFKKKFSFFFFKNK